MTYAEIERRVHILQQAADMLAQVQTFADICRATGKVDLADSVENEARGMMHGILQEGDFLQTKVQEAKQKERDAFVRRGGYRSNTTWA